MNFDPSHLSPFPLNQKTPNRKFRVIMNSIVKGGDPPETINCRKNVAKIKILWSVIKAWGYQAKYTLGYMLMSLYF